MNRDEFMQLPEDEKQSHAKALYEHLLAPPDEYWERMKQQAIRAGQGLDTGIVVPVTDFEDRVTLKDWWVPKNAITILCGRTGGGKTTLMNNVATRLAMKGHRGFFITLEEPGYSIEAKCLSIYTRLINSQFSAQATTVNEARLAMLGKEQCAELDEYRKTVMANMRVIDANSTGSDKAVDPGVMYEPQWIYDLIRYRNKMSTRPLDFLMIDYAQLMNADGQWTDQSFMRIKMIMQAMKNLCGQLGIAVIMGAQLSRATWQHSVFDWEPEMLREGADIEHSANQIIAIGRDKLFEDRADGHRTVIRWLKNRDGPARMGGLFKVEWPYGFVGSEGIEANE